MKIRLVLIIGFWGLNFVSYCWAQAGKGFRFEHITVNEGLSHSDAMSVIQDQESFVWVGTNNGINRYDGYELKKYDLPNDHLRGLSSNRIRALHVAKDGTIWAGSEGTGLFFYDKLKDTFEAVKVLSVLASDKVFLDMLSVTSVLAVSSDADGRVWVATQDFGVFFIDFESAGKVRHVGQVRLHGFHQRDYGALSVFSDKRGKVWIGTIGNGLWVIENQNVKSASIVQANKVAQISDVDIRSIYTDPKGIFWVAADDVVYWVKSQQVNKTTDLVFEKLPHIFHGIQSLYMDSFSRLWVGTNFGLIKLEDPGSYLKKPEELNLETFLPVDGDATSINSGRVHQIMEDSFGNLWLAASSGGLNKVHLRPKQFNQLQRRLPGDASLPNNYVNAISKDEVTGRIYIGTRNGFSAYDPKSKSYNNYLNRLAKGNVTGADVSSFLITKNKIWIGTRYRGMYQMDRSGNSAPERYDNLSGHRPWNYISIEGMAEDKTGRVWAATYDGLMLFSAEGVHVKTYYTENSKLPSNQLTFLLYDKEQDIIWASTTNAGVLKLKEENGVLRILSHFKHEAGNENSFKVNFAWPLLKDKNGTIWIGTIGGGLHAIEVVNGIETVTRYDKWIAENDIESILDDEKGNLWIGGAGLSKFSPVTKKLLRYDVSDGLQSNSFKVGSAFKSLDGTMYFGGTNGINYFKPQNILANPFPPVVRITRLRVLNKNSDAVSGETGSSMISRQFSDPEGVTIKASENDFSFEFVGLNYVNPQKQQYVYKLEGYSNDWVQLPPGQRVASFANLPAGEYTFMVKANNGDGVWSLNPASVQVIILPPWYKTWWAYIGYTLIVAAALILYRRITLSQAELKNRIALEKMHAEKEKEIAEVKINFFTNVSHEFRTPLTLILGPMEEFMASIGESGELKEKVVMMHKQTRKLLDLINQLLSFRKIESGHASLAASRREVIGFMKEIFLIFKVKADERNLDYSINAPEREVMMYFDSEKLEVIITNLLSNAFKYTPEGGRIRLASSVIGLENLDAVWQDGKLTDNYLEISVKDWGYGIRTEELEKIFDPYYQASNATGSNFKGTGIGLALVQQMVQSHSGEVEVQSAVGQGTTFTVKLPFGRKHLSAPDLREDMMPEQYVQLPENTDVIFYSEPAVVEKTAKLLIVEDNADLREYLRGLFESDYEVFLSVDGSEAWTKIPETQPDLILSDVMMPGLNGLDLCKKIKQHPKTSHIPVILLTARAAAVQELEGLETGADDYIAKPFNPKILRAKVSTILQSRNKLLEYYQRKILLEPTEITIPDEDKIFLETAMKIVEDNLTNSEFKVQSLVTAMGMSQSVFYRRVKNITGQSVIEFIKDIRLKRAAQLLTNEHARVSEIALMVGIEDPKNFRISFQKLYNMSPSQYAKAHRGELMAEATTGL
ncbi:hybrid sensor histidine kinase/response regulator transcription factor [Dyadobacter psychrotolerans]|uniref:histidine kinase n=1 Tax=Dyadobacter psychrotolerans TaxID=2541721 RepID=A0A4V2Z3A8_9BACT|nr:two-component regulator propeller domain-containing protein [Dyadobacter psychrotolerans]TDE11268.1 response regulator [Dyadobacter psychrotolerans]